MSSRGRQLGPLGLAAAALLAGGCDSTQEKSRKIAESLGPVKAQEAISITEENTDVEVVDTAVLSDQFGSAVVVTVENSSDEALTEVPILIEVFDAKGNSVFKNDVASPTAPELNAIPYIAPNETVDWVHDAVLAVDVPKTVKAKIGASQKPFEGELPQIEVSTKAQIRKDPTSGLFATGPAINNTDVLEPRLLIFGVVRDGDEVTAAGRAVIEELKAGRRRPYKIFFIGDPEAGEISVTSYPTLEAQEETP